MRPLPMRPLFAALFALPLLATTAAMAAAPAPAPAPAPLAELVRQVDIPYESFTLANGLRVVVHTDRKAPIVGVTVYYRVGSKNEPAGHTGFAHLYEHLFFGGSENAPSFDVPLETAGSPGSNGSTWFDRTNYVEVVPKGALPLALFLESDRMGHLLGALSQDKLDKQRGVVENEKRQDDNQPYGLLQYAVNEGLFPVGHPYRHSPIGSMGDLNAATLGDVRAWFTDHYGPNNAILVLTGDIDAATARPLVESAFGDIARGPAVAPVEAGPVTLKAPITRELKDQVATTRIYRIWSTPALTDPDAPQLAMTASVLGGLASSRLDNALVRGKQLAVSVSADVEQHEQLGIFMASMDIKPGVPRKLAEAAFDAEIARFLATGPTPDELKRAATRAVSSTISGMEVVGNLDGKGTTLAEGLLFAGDSARYKAELAAYAAATPASVRAAARHWLGRPALRLAISPGERTEQGDAMGGWGDEQTRPARPADPKAPLPPVPTAPPRAAPPVAPVETLTFPTIEHARLANGIPVTLARHGAVPKVLVRIAFDAGTAADAVDAPGTQGMLLSMLTEGTAGPHPRGATSLLEEEERLGASIGTGAGMDSSAVTLDALTANLAPSLDLLADVVRYPAFHPADVARVKARRAAELADTLSDPQGIAFRQIAPLLFGPGHPYGQPSDGLGTQASLAALSPDSLAAAHDRWLRPDRARIVVVGDVTMDQLLPLLNAALGDWQAPSTPAPVIPITASPPPARPHILLIDRPGSPQAMILGGWVMPLNGRIEGDPGAQEPLDLANRVLGDGFLSRLNSDLREDKGWSYGVSTILRRPVGQRSLIVYAPVQTDRTGDAIRAILADMKALPATRPVSDEERNRVIEGGIRQLPARYETNAQVLSAILGDQLLGRPEDFEKGLPARWRAIDTATLNAAARDWLQGDGLSFVVVGDAKAVAPQLAGLGLPVEQAPATGSP